MESRKYKCPNDGFIITEEKKKTDKYGECPIDGTPFYMFEQVGTKIITEIRRKTDEAQKR